MAMIDSFGRTIDYLRVSITDRCNFRCVYCMPEEGVEGAPLDDLLSAVELSRLVRIAAELGVRKVRLTGGEPLVRREIVEIVQAIGNTPGIEDLSLTTNGFLLPRYLPELQAGGLKRVNISLDTLREERFVKIARRGSLDSVKQAIRMTLDFGLQPVKLNMVVMRGWNDDELVDFARWTLSEPLHIRFIELMPVNWSSGENEPEPAFSAGPGLSSSGCGSYGKSSATAPAPIPLISMLPSRPPSAGGKLDSLQMHRAYISAKEMRERIEREVGLLSPAEVQTNGPARTFKLEGAPGTLGFISQISNELCSGCNRIRLTSDGQLRPCLMADGEIDLRSVLRDGAEDSEIAELFLHTVRHKPLEHRLEEGIQPVSRNMSQIGG